MTSAFASLLTEPLSSLSVPATLITPPSNVRALADDEQRVLAFLAARLRDARGDLLVSELYYHGMNVVPSLGISIPPELEPLRTVMGWCGAGVDARTDRLDLQGFRMPGVSTIDADLLAAWQASNLDFESSLVHHDSQMFGNAFAIVGPADGDVPPVTTVESPLNMICAWNAAAREVSAAYQTYFDTDPASETFNRQLATLYTRSATVQMVADDRGWTVQDRDDHGLGFVPVVQFANKPTTRNRSGTSEMAAAWRNIQDRAARGTKRNEAAAEFFATMKIWLLGVTEESFEKPDGSIATAWETFTGRISTLEADEGGNLPSIITQQGQDPSGLIRFIDHERTMFASAASIPIDYLGAVNDGNPTSADAITKGDYRLMKRCGRLISQYGNSWEDWARLVLRVWHGSIPADAAQLESDWAKPTIPTPNSDTVTVTTQIAAGMVPADSDDALAAVGWSPVQRSRIAAARARSVGNAALTGVINDLPGLKPQQPLDGEQPRALQALKQSREADAAGSAAATADQA